MEAIYLFDWNVFQWVREHIWGAAMDALMSFVSLTGEAGVIWILLGIVLIIFKKTRKAGFTVLAALLFMQIVNNMILKELISRPRPWEYADWKAIFTYPDIGWIKPSSPSFPSGHTSAAIACAAALLVKRWKIGIPTAVYALLMGFSRIYLHDHYCTDVLGGIFFGILYGLTGVLIVNLIYRAIQKKRGGLPKFLAG